METTFTTLLLFFWENFQSTRMVGSSSNRLENGGYNSPNCCPQWKIMDNLEETLRIHTLAPASSLRRDSRKIQSDTMVVKVKALDET
jgi:hypothetical protein